ncbi:MAG: response regulator [Anaerolineae bacterium]|nr:response regulator [Phycisphaerae bacterium]
MAIASKGKILIADDEKTFVDALADLLRREGYECQTVPDGLAAAAELNTAHQYDLLIADIRMPGNPDLELIKHLPQIAEGLPVILVTAYPDATSALKSADLPVLSYMIKPVNFPELLNLVRRGIEHSAVFRANREIARRLEAWTSDARMIEQLLAKGASGPEIGPAAFVNLSTRNLLGCLSELDAMWRRLAPHSAGSADANALSEAIDRTMRVFEITGASFQQREAR